VVETLIERTRSEADTLILAYTHGQPAQPSTFGHYLGA
jgi:argininosuccinate lyase